MLLHAFTKVMFKTQTEIIILWHRIENCQNASGFLCKQQVFLVCTAGLLAAIIALMLIMTIGTCGPGG